MHPYSIDTDERRNIIFALAVVAALPVFGVAGILDLLGTNPAWWIPVPSIPAAFGILYTAFDKWLWRLAPVRRIGVIRTPALAGSWAGQITSSFDDGATEIPVELTIRQTWTAIGVELRTTESSSHSTSASVEVNSISNPVISYQYRNDPRALAPGAMTSHTGTAVLQLQTDRRLSGEYFTGRGRFTHGEIKLESSSSSAP